MTVALQNYYRACGPYLLGSGAVVQAVCVLILLWGQEVRGQKFGVRVKTLTPNFTVVVIRASRA